MNTQNNLGIGIAAGMFGGGAIGGGLSMIAKRAAAAAPIAGNASFLSKLTSNPLALAGAGALIGGVIAGSILLGNGSLPGDSTRPGDCNTNLVGDTTCNPIPDRVIVNGDGSTSDVYDGDEYYR